MPCPVGCNLVGQFLIDTHGEVPIARASFSPSEEEGLTAIAIYDFRSLWLYLDIIEPMRLTAVKLDAPIAIRRGGKVTEVYDINPYKQEAKAECIEISLPPWLYVSRENLSEFFRGQIALRSCDGSDAVATERVQGRYLVIECIIENGTDVTEVDVTCINAWRGGGTPTEEAIEPCLADIGKVEVRGVLVVSRYLHPRCFINVACACVGVRILKVLIPFRERHWLLLFWMKGADDEVAEFDGGCRFLLSGVEDGEECLLPFRYRLKDNGA